LTLQSREVYFYNGEELYSYDTPLAYHPKKPKFEPLGSFCWRGYQGTWSIRDGKLYLVDLYAHKQKIQAIPNYRYVAYDRRRKDLYYEIHLHPTTQDVYIEDVFPKMKDGKVFAYWFTGYINFGRSDVIGRGMTTSYKKYLSLRFENGILVEEKVRDHDEVYPPRTVEDMMMGLPSRQKTPKL